jgi:hypothetical protein
MRCNGLVAETEECERELLIEGADLRSQELPLYYKSFSVLMKSYSASDKRRRYYLRRKVGRLQIQVQRRPWL